MSNSFDYEQFKANAIEQLKAGVPLSGKDGVLAPSFDYEQFKANAIEQLKAGVPLSGKDGVLAPLLENLLNSALEGEMDSHLESGEREWGNRISAETISSITDRVLPEIQSWKNRPLDRVYPIVWLDAVHYKVMDEKNRPVTRAIYNVLALNSEGRKELLGMYISKSEGANFWLGVLTDLQNRGVQDILIACIDELKGFPDAIASVFPETTVQLCIVHQIRNSVKYMWPARGRRSSCGI